MRERIRVGIIGANPDRGWALRAHVPALAALSDYELIAVATTRTETSRRAADRFGASLSFNDGLALASHPDVDLVVVAVKVPDHLPLIEAAFETKKHVYCEWPLASSASDVDRAVASSRQSTSRHVVGLQGRFSPTIRYAKNLLLEGTVGKVTSVNLYSTRSKGSSIAVPKDSIYTYDAKSGATFTRIYGGHALDIIEYLVGPVSKVAAFQTTQRQAHQEQDSGEPIIVTAADQLLLLATTDLVAAASIHLRDADAASPHTRIQISGTGGNLLLTSEPRNTLDDVQIQKSALRVQIATSTHRSWVHLPVPPSYFTMPPEIHGTPAHNVGQLYKQFADEILRGAIPETSDFRSARDLHRLLFAIEDSHLAERFVEIRRDTT